MAFESSVPPLTWRTYRDPTALPTEFVPKTKPLLSLVYDCDDKIAQHFRHPVVNGERMDGAREMLTRRASEGTMSEGTIREESLACASGWCGSVPLFRAIRS